MRGDCPAREAIAAALAATTAGEVGGEPVTDVYRPEGLAVLVVNALHDAGFDIVEAGRIDRLIERIQREDELQADFVNDLLEQAPEHYDDDMAGEPIALRYLRDLEAVVVALGPVLDLWACDHVPRLGVKVDPECARCQTMGSLRGAYANVTGVVDG